MALKSVGDFQRRIYEVLLEHSILSRKLSGVYLSAPRDTKYPFLVINLVKMKDLSKHIRFNYEIEFELGLYGKDNNQARLLSMADQIIDMINPNIQGLSDYQILALRFVHADWIRGMGANSCKISLNFKALIAGDYE